MELIQQFHPVIYTRSFFATKSKRAFYNWDARLEARFIFACTGFVQGTLIQGDFL